VKKSKVIAVGYENMRLEPWNGPPYIYSVKVNGKIKRMSGFDEEHIKNQLYPKKATMIRKVKDD
jgi:hypothetical protein